MTQASYLVVPRAIPSKIKRSCHLERDIKLRFVVIHPRYLSIFSTTQTYILDVKVIVTGLLDNGRKTDDRYCQLTDFGKLIADIVRFLILSLETYVFSSIVILCSLA